MNEAEIKRLVREVLAGLAPAPGTPAAPAATIAQDPGECPDVTAVSTKDEFFVPHPENRDGYLAMKQSTVARIGVWRAGPRYNTWSMLHFRADHATAQDAVFMDVDDEWPIAQGFVAGQSECTSKDEFLTRPDLGRKLNDATKAKFAGGLTRGAKVTIMVGDGLSSSAMVNIPEILPAIKQGLKGFGIDVGPVPYVKYCRVGAMDDLGPLIDSEVVVLLIGERPGLATGESMSAYMAYKPNPGRPESWRTVVSNIYRGGTPPAEAGAHVATLIKRMLDEKASGVDLKL
ncbi:MAG: ethanolamine ammonia-lyase subunit EutC [Propionibacteriaceae bacterium]|jgi:ethanolamine ammonia-lyase small subunit|nr:ethanolamine ammonia-lyase subunit EutC [Propionibacteriaceae bacterium]